LICWVFHASAYPLQPLEGHSRSALTGAVVVAPLSGSSITPLGRSIGVPSRSSGGSVIWLPGRDGSGVGLLIIVSTLGLGGNVGGTILLLLLLGGAIGGLLGGTV
jgi:hypothetical protein